MRHHASAGVLAAITFADVGKERKSLPASEGSGFVRGIRATPGPTNGGCQHTNRIGRSPPQSLKLEEDFLRIVAEEY